MNDSTKTLPPRPGSALTNGATVITTIDTLHGRRFVLASTPIHMSAHPFATWEMVDGICINGAYFSADDFTSAVGSLYDRVGQHVSIVAGLPKVAA